MPDVVAMSDAVVIDSSPVGLTAEVLDLLPMADTVVMVIRLGHTLTTAARRTMSMLRGLSSVPIHLALISEEVGSSPYYEYDGRSPRKAGREGRADGKADSRADGKVGSKSGG